LTGRPLVWKQHKQQHPFNGSLSGIIQVSQYQKGKTNMDFAEARDSEWQWHQLDHVQICISPQTSPFIFYRLDALPATQTTLSKHGRQKPLVWKIPRKPEKPEN